MTLLHIKGHQCKLLAGRLLGGPSQYLHHAVLHDSAAEGRELAGSSLRVHAAAAIPGDRAPPAAI